jgi:tetratricopeptide (TPR) repeat protein
LSALDEFKVLDALIREISERKKKMIKDPRVQYTILLNRVIKENNALNESSARPQTSRYLKDLKKEGHIEKEKIGRNVFYDVTAKGRFYHLSNRDRLDHSRKWFEEALKGCYLSYAVVPPEYGLIHDRRDYNKELKGKEMLQEAIKQLKEMNPDLDSIYIRLGDEEQ